MNALANVIVHGKYLNRQKKYAKKVCYAQRAYRRVNVAERVFR